MSDSCVFHKYGRNAHLLALALIWFGDVIASKECHGRSARMPDLNCSPFSQLRRNAVPEVREDCVTLLETSKSSD